MSIRVCCCTWNVHGQQPGDENLHEWMRLSEENALDVFVIGLQEVPCDPQSLLLDYYIRTDPWTRRLRLYLGSRGLVVVDYIRMLGLLLIVAVRSVHLPFVRDVTKSHVRTALWGLLGFKGALGIRFELFGETFCFINGHFTAGDGYRESRNLDYKAVMAKLLFTTGTATQYVLDHRYIFFIGDFNYRLQTLGLEDIKSRVSEGRLQELLENDELLISRANGDAFVEFQEIEIAHPPTYKYNLLSNDFDTSVKERKPAWCDRILWCEKSTNDKTVTGLSYTSHMNYAISDHKPVSATFSITNQLVANPKPTVEFRFDPSFVPWTTEEDGVCVFHVFGYQTSSWDWIGLYRLDFNYIYDYFTYEWSVTGADESGEDGCMVLFDDVPEEPGFYVFGYYSRKMKCFLGISEPFEVILQPDEPQEVTVDVPQSDKVTQEL